MPREDKKPNENVGQAQEAGKKAPKLALSEAREGTKDAGAEARKEMKADNSEKIAMTSKYLDVHKEEKDLIFAEMVKAFKEPIAFPKNEKGFDKFMNDLANKATDAFLASDDKLWKLVSVPKFIAKARYNRLLGGAFAHNTVFRFQEALKVEGEAAPYPTPKEGMVYKAALSYDKASHRLKVDVQEVKDDASAEGDIDQALDEVSGLTSDQEAAVENLMNQGGLAGVVLSFFGIVPEYDEKKYKTEAEYKAAKRKALNGIVSKRGVNGYIGHLICGLLGFGFAKGSVDALAAKLPPEYGEKLVEVQDAIGGGMETLMGEENLSGVVKVEKFFDGVVQRGGATKTLDKKLAFVNDEMVPSGHQLELKIPAGKKVSLKTGPQAVKATEVVDGEVVALTLADGVIAAEGRNREVLIEASQLLAKGTIVDEKISVKLVAKS
jgi:hypothetical protein